jgi:hypothetical protein
MGYWEQPCIVMGMCLYIYIDNIVGFFVFLSLSKYWGYNIFWNIVGYWGYNADVMGIERDNYSKSCSSNGCNGNIMPNPVHYGIIYYGDVTGI